MQFVPQKPTSMSKVKAIINIGHYRLMKIKMKISYGALSSG
jgi:hypothetical protein